MTPLENLPPCPYSLCETRRRCPGYRDLRRETTAEGIDGRHVLVELCAYQVTVVPVGGGWPPTRCRHPEAERLHLVPA